MILIDTHAHLYLSQFKDDIDEVVNAALEKKIGKIILPNIDSRSIPYLRKLSDKYENIFIPLMGLHPTSVKENYKEELQKIITELEDESYAGVGEIGIDLYWDKTYKDQQASVFREQLNYASQHQLPVVIHARDSFNEIFEVLEEFSTGKLTGIFHAFTGTEEDAKKIINKGLKIGIGGILTFKNSGLDEVVKKININNIVLETDSPYLAPVPKRGKRNESSYLVYIAQKIADIHGISVEQVAKVTTTNAKQIFNIQ